MEKKRKFRVPIAVKTVLIILTFAFTIVFVAMGFFATSITRHNKEDYQNLATNVTSTVSEIIDANEVKAVKDRIDYIIEHSEEKPHGDEESVKKWDEDLSKFDEVVEMDEYKHLLDFLTRIDNSCDDRVECVYLSYRGGTKEDPYFVYIVDSAPEEDRCYPGTIDVLYEINRGIIDNPDRGFPPYETNTDYGWLTTAGVPIYNGEKVTENLVAYAMVDISMKTVQAEQVKTIMTVFFWLVLTVLLISVVGVVLIHFILVLPIMKLKRAADKYNVVNQDGMHDHFNKTKIRTFDEVRDLWDSMRNMENDINNHISELVNVNNELKVSQQETKELSELAVRDGLTGVHNKISYNIDTEKINEEINRGETPIFGIAMIDLNYLKVTNDTHGHDVGDRALKKLTKAICGVFHRYRVYRIGGDEFVVLIRNIAEDKVKPLIEQFYKNIDELNEKEFLTNEKISAALGYAQYDKKHDRNVDDVFKRADRTMYYNKFEMKKNDGK